MRRSYYDQDGLSQPSAARRSAEPYGIVPPQPSQDIEPPAEEAAQPILEITPVPRRRGRGVRRFALLVALILLLTGTGVLVNGGIPALVSPADKLEDVWDSFGPGWDWGYGYYYEEADDWTAQLESTDMPLAPIGDGTVLTLLPGDTETLTPQEIYAKVAPSVVGIRVTLSNGMATGTGVIMSPDGYVITNAHVIAGAERVRVTLSDDSRKEARLVGYDGSTDLAVLKLDAQDLPAADFGDSSLLRVGEAAYAIGNPLGEELRGTMTDGIISAIDRNMDMNGQEMTLLQTTAALNPGNSGGALVNASGQVVGITNMKMMSDWETIEGLGFAIPTALAKEVVDQIIETGSYVGAPSIGITVYTHPADADAPAGALISRVEPNSDAYTKGLRPGDIIIRANGADITSVRDLEQAKAGLKVGDVLKLTVWKEGRERTVSVRLVGSNEL